MITVPVWLFATLCGIAGLATLSTLAALTHANQRVDRILDHELGPRPAWIGDQEQEDRAQRGQTPTTPGAA